MIESTSVLVVDDLPQSATRLGQSLRRLGYETLVASSASDALVALEERQLELVVVEAHLAGGRGLDLCRQISWRRPDLAVIEVASANEGATAREAEDAGAYDLLVTPLSDAELRYRVDRALKRRELEQRLRVLREVMTADTGSSHPGDH